MLMKLFFSFLVGLVSSWVMLIFAMRVHQFSRRFDDLCDSLKMAADLAVDCRLSDSNCDRAELEARVVGQQQLISRALDSIGQRLGRSDQRDWAKYL